MVTTSQRPAKRPMNGMVWRTPEPRNFLPMFVPLSIAGRFATAVEPAQALLRHRLAEVPDPAAELAVGRRPVGPRDDPLVQGSEQLAALGVDELEVEGGVAGA